VLTQIANKLFWKLKHRRDAEMIRGDGDAKAAAIYSNVYTQDPEILRILFVVFRLIAKA